jgi:thymidine phosphorylase
MGGLAKEEEAIEIARNLLESGKAYEKFVSICNTQGAFRKPVFAKYKLDIVSEKQGTVTEIDNRRLAKVAKLAGAPKEKSAGIYFVTPIGTKVINGQTLFTIYSESQGELDYTAEYLKTANHIITIS